MNGGGQPLRNVAKIALAALLVLLTGAFVFYKERVLFADTAYILFNILNYHSFSIQEHRYGSFITQLVPYLGQLFHLPVRVLIVGYGVSFNLFYFVAGAVLVYRLRQYFLAVLMAFYYFLFVSQSYFWINNEIHQAVAWMFLLVGALLYYGDRLIKNGWLMLCYCLLAFLTVFTHFIVIIPLVFLFIYLWLDNRYWPFSKRQSLIPASIILGVIAAKYVFSVCHPSWDSVHLHGVTHFSFKDVYQSFSRPVATVFLQRCLNCYWPAIIVFISGIASLIYTRQRKKAAWVVISVIGYFIIMGLTYAGDEDGKIELFHIESEWQCLGIIIATPFVFSFLPALKTSVASVIVIIFFLIRLIYIVEEAPVFKWRIQFQEQVLAQMRKKNITKLVLYDNTAGISKKYLLNWGAPYESLFRSVMDGDNPQLVFSFVNPDDSSTLSALKPDRFNTGFGTIPTHTLNTEYFITDTTHPYEVMAYDEFLK